MNSNHVVHNGYFEQPIVSSTLHMLMASAKICVQLETVYVSTTCVCITVQ